MSFAEKPDGTSKDEWVAKLEEGSHIQRVSMNNLIMNYLVTGKSNLHEVTTIVQFGVVKKIS